MHPTLETFSTSDTMIGGFLLCFLKGSDTYGLEEIAGPARQEKRPRYPALELQKATVKASEFRQLNQVRLDTLCMSAPTCGFFHSVLCVAP